MGKENSGRWDPKRRKKNHKRRLIKSTGPVCIQCRETFKPDELTIDHIVPLSAGGCKCQGNLQLMCFPCNNMKGSVRDSVKSPGHTSANCPGVRSARARGVGFNE